MAMSSIAMTLEVVTEGLTRFSNGDDAVEVRLRSFVFSKYDPRNLTILEFIHGFRKIAVTRSQFSY